MILAQEIAGLTERGLNKDLNFMVTFMILYIQYSSKQNICAYHVYDWN